MVLGESGRDSLSEFERVASAHPLYGLLIKPKTGRTHQIRVHLESLGCPVVSDTLYGYEPKRWPIPELNPILKDYPGIFLHAEELEFSHPATGKGISLRTEPPQGFQKIWRDVFGKSDWFL
jgi:23S rRNA-/tRNA-specific pseudouridylate synthase